MRESKKIEKTHLPKSTYEAWSEDQSPGAGKTKHRNPPEDLYEAWMKKRIGRKVRRAGSGAKKARRATS